MAIHLPFFREIPVAMDYSRLAQGLSLGLRSGLSPETSLELTKDLISQPVILERLRKASLSWIAEKLFPGLLQNPVCSAAWKAVSSRYPFIPVPVTKPSQAFPAVHRKIHRSDLTGSLHCGAYHRDPAVSSCGAGPFIRNDAASGDPLRFCNVRW